MTDKEFNIKCAREIMGWVGAKSISGVYPWDIGARPEDSEFDGKSEPKGGTYPFFTIGKTELTVFSRERGMSGFSFSPATKWSDAGWVYSKLIRDSKSPREWLEEFIKNA